MTENTCNCDQFKKACQPGSGADAYFPAIWSGETNYEIGSEPIKFCPWCGKTLPTHPEIKMRDENCRNHTMMPVRHVTLTDVNGHTTEYDVDCWFCLQCSKIVGDLKNKSEKNMARDEETGTHD